MPINVDMICNAWSHAFYRVCEATPDGWCAKRGEVRAGVTRVPTSSLNVAWSMAPDPDLAALDELATRVSEFGVPWSIIVRGSAGGAVADLAARHGLTTRGERPFMVCPADDAVLRADDSRQALIRPVGAQSADSYTAALTTGFEVPDGFFGSLMGGGVLDAPDMTGYLAEEAGELVATGFGIRGGGGLAVFNIAVVPPVRGRGLGRAMTARVVADGFAAGAEAAYLNPSAAAQPLYESMGFRVVESWAVFTAS
ncbi:GNAT family N-acetyltransferase [Catellatospora citrea]|uniref:N-acetyltransferase domain-containing protein n=1 Tax=Catellatospora citrea TaxID=53366 RepID=A0A8J3P3R2_9ACTN|nr:GNAT family N-acetyltransferase [Catellatospora citrea]RKE10611.1 acetyltransferase (GNAT) family protein [Catellatospora citrea]GIG02896.1 hypothetical protein Cci01nite_79890 [Catellatospora citrea]